MPGTTGPGQERGTNLPGQLYTHTKIEGHVVQGTTPRKALRSFTYATRFRTHTPYFEDFTGQANLPASVKARSVGTPTTTAAIVANDPDGTVVSTLAATSELEVAGMDWGDQRIIPGNVGFLFQALTKVTGAVAANDDVIIGVIATFNSTLASIPSYAWFRLSASMVLTAETNDGTTATLANLGDGRTLVTAVYNLFSIDTMQRRGRAHFYLGDDLFADLPWAALSSATANQLQPIVAVRKASGTDVISVTTDYWFAEWQRTTQIFP